MILVGWLTNGTPSRSGLVATIRRLIEANQRLSARASSWIAHEAQDRDIEAAFDVAVARLMNTLRAGVVVDVGTGRSCRFAHLRAPRSPVRIIGVDISEEELRANADIDEKRCADVTKELPFRRSEVDLLVSRSVVEHLSDVESFIANSALVVKQGGYFVNLFPSKFAPYALVNRVLPSVLASRLVLFCFPSNEGRLGFRAYYDACYSSRFVSLLKKYGFEIVEHRVSYHQAYYFSAFFPAYLLNILYESVVWRLGAKDLGARVLIVARKR